ncbi:amino acid permease/ SLC12A domain-containing protein [Xylaria cf. heliscus]|nr:amino acid permease/ SLC12A domain-containing protein [Xylaria cf. heliscus]
MDSNATADSKNIEAGISDEKNSSGDLTMLQGVHSFSAGETELVQNSITHRTMTHRGIKARQAYMIAIGGIIGTGLFVGTGQALALTGPLSVFLAYVIICFVVYGMMTTVITVGTYVPLEGSSMAVYASRYVSKSLGFAMGWLYWYSMGIIVAYEVTAASIVIAYWPNNVHVAVWLTILLAIILGLNLMPVKFYAESEFWFASLKILLIIGLLLLTFIVAVGGGPTGKRIGFLYWYTSEPMKEYLITGKRGRFAGFVYALVFSLFSFLFGPELIVLTSGEMKNPRRNLPITANTFIWRLVFFYCLSALAVGIICPSDAQGLTTSSGAAASPWAIGIKQAGIRGLDSVVNGGILLSAWSSGNSYLYMASRSLYSMALEGSAPKCFARTNRWGVPVRAVLATACYGLLAYLNVSSSGGAVFNWFVSLTNTAGIISWICCCIVFLRFTTACKVQEIADLPYKSIFQPYVTWVNLVVLSILLLLNGFSVFFRGRWSINSFLTAYIGVPVFLLIYFCHRIVHRKDPWAYSPEKVDLKTGLAEMEAIELEYVSQNGSTHPNSFLAKIL